MTAKRTTELIAAYVLACAAPALTVGLVFALCAIGALLLSGKPSVGDLFILGFGVPLLNSFMVFVLLSAQSLPWVLVLFWASDGRARQVATVAAAPVFGSALYWFGEIAADNGALAVSVWAVPFGHVGIAASALAITTLSFFFIDAALRSKPRN